LSYEVFKAALHQLKQLNAKIEELENEKEDIKRRRSAKLGERTNIPAIHEEISV
jgi:uncharacterized protein (UPF0335 family)